MFDHVETPATAPWHAALCVGDIVLFRFPMPSDGEAQDRPVMRPCLVLEIMRNRARPRMVLVPGVPHRGRAPCAYEIAVRTRDEIAAAGLPGPCRFWAPMMLRVSPDHPNLRTKGGAPSPVIGRLTDLSHARMQQVRARLQAAYDIAADRRLTAQRNREDASFTPAALRLLDAYWTL